MQETQFKRPAGVHEKHGAYYFVQKRKWTWLCRIADGRFKLYASLVEAGIVASDTVWYAVFSYLKDGMGELAEETKLGYRGAGMRMVHHFGHYRLDEVEPTHCKQYLVWCKANKRAASGNREKAMMSSVWEYAMGLGWVVSNPWRGIRRNKERPSKAYVEHEALTTEMDRAPPQLVPLYGTAYLLGIRQTDLRLARKDQISYSKAREKYVLKVVESKTGKENEHELTPTVLKILNMAFEHVEAVALRYEASAARLEKWSKHKRAQSRRERAAEVRAQPYIFLSANGRHWTKSGLQSALRRFGPAFKFRSLRGKAQTDSDKNILGHVGQMRELYTKKRKLSAVK